MNWLSSQTKAPPILQRTPVSKGYLYPLFVMPFQIFIPYVNEFLDAYSCPVPFVKHLVFQTAKQPFAGGIVLFFEGSLLIIIAVFWQFEPFQQQWQRIFPFQGINSRCLLPVFKGFRVDAGVFF